MMAALRVIMMKKICVSCARQFYTTRLLSVPKIQRKNLLTGNLFQQHRFVKTLNNPLPKSREFSSLPIAHKYSSTLLTASNHGALSYTNRFFCTSHVANNDHNNNGNFTLRNVMIQTNIGYYDEKPEGLVYNVSYVDTCYDEDVKSRWMKPVALLLHGAPGTYKNMLALAPRLADRGFRVVIPNLPGYDLTVAQDSRDEDFFTHSTEEKVQFLVDFLSTVSIQKVHFIVGHSMGCAPMWVLAANSPSIKCAVSVNSPPGTEPWRLVSPYKLLQLLNRSFDSYILRKFSTFFLSLWTKSVKKFPADTMDQLIASIRTVINMNFNLMGQTAMQIQMTRRPVMYALTDRDPFIEVEKSLRYAHMMGIPREAFEVVDRDGNTVEKASLHLDHAKGVIIQRGTHNPLVSDTYVNVILDRALQLYDSVDKKS